MRRIFNILLAGVSIVGLTYLLTQSDFMREQLAPFLFRLSLIIRDLLLSLPDIVYWAIFCTIMLVVAFATVFRLFLIWLNESDAPLNNDPTIPVGPVQRYAESIENTVDGTFYRRQLARDLTVFSFDLFQRPESGLPEIDAALAKGDVAFSPEIIHYMREGTTRKDITASDRVRNGLTAAAALDGLTATVAMLEAELSIDPPEEETA